MMLEGLTGITKSSYTGDDLISRQDAIDAFGLSEKTRKYGGDHSGYNTMMLYEIQDVLESLPSADRPTGEWIKTEHCLNDTGYRRWIEIECPFCGERPTYEFLENMNYCPNCGARLVGDSDG